MVLILVLVDDGLGEKEEEGGKGKKGVLILVLVDDGLGEENEREPRQGVRGLNPCFSG